MSAAEEPDPAATADAAVGGRIRQFRTARKLSLRQLADRAGISAGFLSQVERGQVNASVGTLRRLSEVLGILLPDLFTDDEVTDARILRKADRPAIEVSDLSAKYLLSQKPLQNLEVYAGELSPGSSAGEAYVHGDAQEILIVTSGKLTVELAGERYELEAGDSAEYRTSVPHTVHNLSDAFAELIWIVSPPTDWST
ncbi:transcriptional regulator with XRE-family HTH domain [Mycobacterium frederiksbergense]|uniref:Transcriptional regulator with XRE-family HTH domain n=1 Tax=Mycolicibacterium frederiksbergense TaxID=117567 RepID=A0ABT6L1U9_9MYCO|nr:cupin domain-containing protein [Mycolicibacterium frederiksbergense]MDH6196893.1 transcriptional regulator with XRE-family HTH domain [Mycolicibacterium frederiksbergense]